MNKYSVAMLLVCVGMVRMVCAEAAAIYQVADMAGNTEYQILTKEEFTKLSNEIKEEQKVMAAVVTAAKKEWEADKTNKMPFPASKIKPRMFKKLSQDFPSRDVASERLAQMEERAAKKLAEEKNDKTKNRSSKKSDPDDAAKDALKQSLANSAIADVNRRMGEKLGREVPMYGFVATTKKDAKKPAAAPAKKEEPKKDDAKKDEAKKDDAKKEAEKKPAH